MYRCGVEFDDDEEIPGPTEDPKASNIDPEDFDGD